MPTAESSSDAAARDEKPERPGPCDQSEHDEVPIVDDTRRLLEETLCSTALWVDGIFGDKGDIAAARRVRGYLEVSTAYSEFEGTKVRVRMNVRADLPVLKRRLSAFVGRDNEDDYVRDRSEGFALRSQFPRLDDREGWLAGLGYGLPGSGRLESDFRFGARGLNPPKVFVQWRNRYNIYADPNDVVYVRGTPFWNSKDGLGFTSSLDYSHVLTPVLLVRLGNAATVSEETEGVDWRSALILYQNLGEKRAIAYEAFVRGTTDVPEPLGEYGGRAIYRHPLARDKLFGELVLGYSWPRDDPALEREGSVGVGISVEMPFGQKK